MKIWEILIYFTDRDPGHNSVEKKNNDCTFNVPLLSFDGGIIKSSCKKRPKVMSISKIPPISLRQG